MIYKAIRDLDFSVIVEAGGNTGVDTVKLCDMFPNATVHTFEPIPLLYEHIKSFNKNNLKLYNKALSDKNGKFDFYMDMNPEGLHGASSLLKASEHYKNYVGYEQKIKVDCTTLKSFMINEGVDVIDFMWLDIEQYEYKMLKASEECLKKIKYLYTEINYSNFRDNQDSAEDLITLLEDNKFELLFLAPQGNPIRFSWQGNGLFLNRGL